MISLTTFFFFFVILPPMSKPSVITKTILTVVRIGHLLYFTIIQIYIQIILYNVVGLEITNSFGQVCCQYEKLFRISRFFVLKNCEIISGFFNINILIKLRHTVQCKDNCFSYFKYVVDNNLLYLKV